MANNHIKRQSCYQSSGKYKVKTQWDKPNWTKQNRTKQNKTDHSTCWWSNWKITYTVGRKVKWSNHFAKEYVRVKNLKHVPIIWPSHLSPRYLCRRKENICPDKCLYMNVQSSFSCNSPKLERVQMFISRWKYKQIRIFISLAIKRNKLLINTT